MAQLGVLLEQMVQGMALRLSWRFWDSPSAALTASGVAAVALRIHALDEAIVYNRVASKGKDGFPTAKPVLVVGKQKGAAGEGAVMWNVNEARREGGGGGEGASDAKLLKKKKKGMKIKLINPRN